MQRWLMGAVLLVAGCATPHSHWSSSNCHRCCNSSSRFGLVDIAVGGLLGALFSARKKPEQAPPPARQPVVATPSPVYRSPRSGRISTRVMFAGGHLKLTGLPEKSRDEVVLSLRSLAALDAVCALDFYVDGEPLTVGEHVRRSNYELLVTLRIDELGESERFRGTACGQSFELDEAGRDTIANFASRFHERVAELSAPSRTPT